jgi:hypothetical protein
LWLAVDLLYSLNLVSSEFFLNLLCSQ